jgi:formate dehydrogenase assembly factor FdhD
MYYPGIHVEGMRKITKTSTRITCRQGRESIPGPLEYKGVLTTQPRRSVYVTAQTGVSGQDEAHAKENNLGHTVSVTLTACTHDCNRALDWFPKGKPIERDNEAVECCSVFLSSKENVLHFIFHDIGMLLVITTQS